MLVADLLQDLKLHGFQPQLWPANPALLEIELRRACFDSRELGDGDLFCALTGTKHVGMDFLNHVADSEAKIAMVGEVRQECEIPQVQVKGDMNIVAAHVARVLACRPDQKLWTSAVTGTNGKTTVAHFIRAAISALGKRAASCGTLGMIDGTTVHPNLNTTPRADLIQNWLADLVEDGFDAAVVEASSHGIVQGRLAALQFACVGFTNLSPEHLDYHHTMEQYAAAKTSLITTLPSSSIAFIPHQDNLIELCSESKCSVETWSASNESADHVCDIKSTSQGIHVSGKWQGTQFQIESKLCGQHNGENLFLAALMLCAKGEDVQRVASALSTIGPADGRLQQVAVSRGIAFVDYAHTPDALEKVLSALRQSYPESRIKVVFGAGGDRDNSKRQLMGQAVSNFADWCVLTSDNPRTEDPEKIIADVAVGIDDQQIDCAIIADRSEAIDYAVAGLEEGEVLLVAGKGHETYQEINGVRSDFDDRLKIVEANQCLA